MRIKGENIYIEPLKEEDVFEMRKWGTHKNPLLEDYNFPEMNDLDVKRWYRVKVSKHYNKYYAIKCNDGRLIGYMGIKDIKKWRKQSTLGLVLDPNEINKGYGTEILSVFLEYYFSELEMKKMILEVAEFNKKAYRLYEKMGFKKTSYYLEEFFSENFDLENLYYLAEKTSFVISEKRVYNYIYEMELTQDDFFEARRTLRR